MAQQLPFNFDFLREIAILTAALFIAWYLGRTALNLFRRNQ